MPNLPLELVAEIIHKTLEFNVVDRPGVRNKPSWDLISSLSLTCKSYRELVLKAWFRRFYTENHNDTTRLTERIPRAEKSWVKQIHCVHRASLGLRYNLSWDLEGYNRLELLRLDWLVAPIPHAGNSFEHSEYLPFINAPHTIATFDFRGLYWPYPNAYLFIHQCLPSIRNLMLHQQEVWCCLCFTVNEVKFAEPVPRRLLYKDGFGLPIHYAKALKSLHLLEHVTVNIPVFNSGSTSLNQTNNENMWVGECDSCMRLLYTDSSFVNAYVSRKKKGVFRSIDGTECKWPRPPGLKSVEWTFFRAAADDEHVLSTPWEESSEAEDAGSDPESEGGNQED